jgi:hypothetical protein
VLESGLLQEREARYELTGPLPPLAITPTLHDSLMARLDRLGPVKEVAQIAAVIGREFSYELLAAVADLPEPDLQSALRQLSAAELAFGRGEPPDAVYAFKHVLVQETAYNALLRPRRERRLNKKRLLRSLSQSPRVLRRIRQKRDRLTRLMRPTLTPKRSTKEAITKVATTIRTTAATPMPPRTSPTWQNRSSTCRFFRSLCS